jgi:ABC-type transport system involved in multi-copper enzyme maturation permease subunit
VIFAVTFVAGLVAGAVALPIGAKLLQDNNNVLYPISWVTELRLLTGTAALLAMTAVFALAVAALLRRSVATVVVVIGLTVLPYILASASVLPADAGKWLLRLLPAAAFAIQQSRPAYHQVDELYTPASGFFPLSPWTGFAVLCGYTAIALALASYRLRRRDA